MRKFIANIICAFVPTKQRRHRVRKAIEFGLVRYFKIMRAEPGLKFKHYLSVCAIAKNEGPYFQEWIEYHLLVGVEKFYIYDNESNDDTKKVLAPYIKSGIVEYTYWPGEKQQLPAYEDCIKRHKFDTRWLAIIDLDEFIVPVATKTIPEFLRSLAPGVSQLLIGWVLYGSSGHETKPEGLVIENYKRRGKDNSSSLFKAIINPRMCYYCQCHFHDCAGKTIDENGTEVMTHREDFQPFDKNRIRINHYHCKSWQEYRLKRNRGDAFFGNSDKYDRHAFDGHDQNDILDPIMDKYIAILRRIL